MELWQNDTEGTLCEGANLCTAAAEEREDFSWPCTACAAAAATPDCSLHCWRVERHASPSSVSEGGEMGEVGGVAVPPHLQFPANVKAMVLGEDMLAE